MTKQTQTMKHVEMVLAVITLATVTVIVFWAMGIGN
jgi:hypothetical protein